MKHRTTTTPPLQSSEWLDGYFAVFEDEVVDGQQRTFIVNRKLTPEAKQAIFKKFEEAEAMTLIGELLDELRICQAAQEVGKTHRSSLAYRIAELEARLDSIRTQGESE